MLTELGKRIDEHCENANKELENTKKIQSELKNSIMKFKKALEGINSRLGDAEEHISNLEDKTIAITQSEKEKKLK